MKVLITGARGQIGRAVIKAAPATAQLIAVTHSELDIGDAIAVDRYVGSAEPDVIVNTAAYTAVDRAESESEQARIANAIGPANLARIAAESGARMIHLSTDFVFDGMGSAPYRPEDPANPLSVYGATKLAGEIAVREILAERSLVLRTAWVYDAGGRNFLLTMLRLMRERGVVRVVADQFGTPTASHSIAVAIWAIVAKPSLEGIHHWTDSGVASWYDFAVAIAEEWAMATNASTVANVVPISTSDYPAPARRPRFSVLDKSATVAVLGMTPPHWRQNLRQVIGEIAVA
jgi:dTDP-4-dehydrorhamnose reductase